jgi:hypothetical protein
VRHVRALQDAIFLVCFPLVQSYSVAEHSLLVERLIIELKENTPKKWRLAALLHDAPEYVIGDMISPFKAAIGINYKDVEANLESAIHIRFGLPAILPEQVKRLIKRADRLAAFIEATQLAGFSIMEAQDGLRALSTVLPVLAI